MATLPGERLHHFACSSTRSSTSAYLHILLVAATDTACTSLTAHAFLTPSTTASTNFLFWAMQTSRAEAFDSTHFSLPSGTSSLYASSHPAKSSMKPRHSPHLLRSWYSKASVNAQFMAVKHLSGSDLCLTLRLALELLRYEMVARSRCSSDIGPKRMSGAAPPGLSATISNIVGAQCSRCPWRQCLSWHCLLQYRILWHLLNTFRRSPASGVSPQYEQHDMCRKPCKMFRSTKSRKKNQRVREYGSSHATLQKGL